MKVNYLGFADDVIIFTIGSNEALDGFMELMDTHREATGHT